MSTLDGWAPFLDPQKCVKSVKSQLKPSSGHTLNLPRTYAENCIRVSPCREFIPEPAQSHDITRKLEIYKSKSPISETWNRITRRRLFSFRLTRTIANFAKMQKNLHRQVKWVRFLVSLFRLSRVWDRNLKIGQNSSFGPFWPKSLQGPSKKENSLSGDFKTLEGPHFESQSLGIPRNSEAPYSTRFWSNMTSELQTSSSIWSEAQQVDFYVTVRASRSWDSRTFTSDLGPKLVERSLH